MRQIGTVPNLEQAQRFCDYLHAIQIPAVLEQRDAAWLLWVQEEDQVARARGELAAFREDPDGPRFLSLSVKVRDEREQATRRVLDEAARAVTPTRLPTLAEISRRAPLTMAILWLTVFVTLSSSMGSDWTSKTLQSLSFQNPAHALVDGPAALVGTLDIQRGEWWRLATPVFLHFGWIHWMFSLLLMCQLGWLIETRRGSWQFGLVLLLTAIVGNLGQYLAGGSTMFGGLSGVIFGLVAFAWVGARTNPQEGMWVPNESIVILLVFLVAGFTGNLDELVSGAYQFTNWAHVFGLATGALLAVTLPGGWPPPPEQPAEPIDHPEPDAPRVGPRK